MTSPAAPLASKKTGKSRCKAAREGHEEGREQGRLSWAAGRGRGLAAPAGVGRGLRPSWGDLGFSSRQGTPRALPLIKGWLHHSEVL